MSPHLNEIQWGVLRGAMAGGFAKTMVYPVDRVKMIYQVKGATIGHFRVSYILHDLLSIVQKEGFLSLWKGNFAAFARTFPHSGISYAGFDAYKKVLGDCKYLESHDMVAYFIAGGLAGTTATLMTYPLDVWNTRMAVSKGAYKYKQIMLLKYDGFASLYRGLVPTLLGIIPYAAISFSTFETLKQKSLRRKYSSQTHIPSDMHYLSKRESMICGAVAGVASQTATYPLDTVRKFMQANPFLFSYGEEGHYEKRQSSIISTVKHIYKSQGLRGYYNGVSLVCVKGSTAAGISFTLHETLRQFF